MKPSRVYQKTQQLELGKLTRVANSWQPVHMTSMMG